MRWTESDRRFMKMAFAQAESVKGKTLPNPAVGAVLVKNGRVVGKGGTRPAGQAHAEVVALEKARTDAAGATLYVTLEPCCHFGKTPPCTRALIAAGVKRVVAACADPSSQMSGKGFSELRRAGIDVKVGLLEDRAQEFYEGYFFYVRHGRPQIILKVAQSLDGRINAAPRVETEITGLKARTLVHALRTRVDAILIGGETLRSDNPDLTPRLVKGPVPEALVLTRKSRLSSAYRLFAPDRASRTVVMTSAKGPFKELPSGTDAVRIPAGKDGKPLEDEALAAALMESFGQRNYHSILVEGGRSVWAPFLNAGLCDVFYLFTGSKLLSRGERWDAALRSGWAKNLEFHRFTALESDDNSDVLTEFRRV
jgi:diaminohydroxyphosphoribosylaminopyrimidine deaminase/5-amino-6-(5-phosphoribosylamino)uracil reductase